MHTRYNCGDVTGRTGGGPRAKQHVSTRVYDANDCRVNGPKNLGGPYNAQLDTPEISQFLLALPLHRRPPHSSRRITGAYPRGFPRLVYFRSPLATRFRPSTLRRRGPTLSVFIIFFYFYFFFFLDSLLDLRSSFCHGVARPSCTSSSTLHHPSLSSIVLFSYSLFSFLFLPASSHVCVPFVPSFLFLFRFGPLVVLFSFRQDGSDPGASGTSPPSRSSYFDLSRLAGPSHSSTLLTDRALGLPFVFRKSMQRGMKAGDQKGGSSAKHLPIPGTRDTGASEISMTARYRTVSGKPMRKNDFSDRDKQNLSMFGQDPNRTADNLHDNSRRLPQSNYKRHRRSGSDRDERRVFAEG